jgi:hypothetical protein
MIDEVENNEVKIEEQISINDVKIEEQNNNNDKPLVEILVEDRLESVKSPEPGKRGYKRPKFIQVYFTKILSKGEKEKGNYQEQEYKFCVRTCLIMQGKSRNDYETFIYINDNYKRLNSIF